MSPHRPKKDAPRLKPRASGVSYPPDCTKLMNKEATGCKDLCHKVPTLEP